MKDYLEKYKNIAVYGMSANAAKPSHTVPMFMHKQGYNIFPINPTADEIGSLKVYRKLIDIPEHIDILNVFRPSEEALDVVKEAVERKHLKGDIRLIWLQLGIENEEAKALALKNDIAFIQNKCMYVEYINM
jgi:predicted CoA-binding protein